jgi:hypothetical protein
MASGLEALVGAATEGMRKTQSAEEMMKAETLDVLPSVTENGHMSDSAAAPMRERKKGACFFFAPISELTSHARAERATRVQNAPARAERASARPCDQCFTTKHTTDHPQPFPQPRRPVDRR